jgi:hypothetical protein
LNEKTLPTANTALGRFTPSPMKDEEMKVGDEVDLPASVKTFNARN